MKRAGIIFCVLAVLAVGWMTAANIAVGAVAEDVRFESELRAGSREAAGGVRILGEGVDTTVNDEYMYFDLAYDAGSGVGSCDFSLEGGSRPVQSLHVYDLYIFDQLNSSGSSNGGIELSDLPAPCAAVAARAAAGQTLEETMYLSEVCDYYPLRVDSWGAIHLDEELQAAVDEHIRLPVPEDLCVTASVTKDAAGNVCEYECRTLQGGRSGVEVQCYNLISSCLVSVRLWQEDEEGITVWQPGPLYHMDTVWNEARNEYEPVPESFRLLSVEVCPDSAVEAPGGGALLLETGAEFCRLTQLSPSGELLTELSFPRLNEDERVYFYLSEDADADWFLIEQGSEVRSFVRGPEGLFASGPVYDLSSAPATEFIPGSWPDSVSYDFDGERLACLTVRGLRFTGAPIVDDPNPTEPRDRILQLAVVSPGALLFAEDLYCTLTTNGVDPRFSVEMG